MANDVFPFAVWLSGTNQNSIPANDNALRVEVITGPALSVISAQPASPSEDDQHILGPAPSGAQWSAFSEDDVVIFKGGTWLAFAPYQGWLKFNADDGNTYQWDSGWAVFSGGGGGGSTAWEDITGVPQPIADLAALTDPGADRLIFWDDSAGEYTHLSLGTNLSVSDTTLNAAGGGGGGGVVETIVPGTGITVDDSDPANPIISATGGGGGLTNWTEGLNTSTPNETTPYVTWSPDNAESKVNLALLPKGGGALTLSVPNNSSSGGDARGTRAVDLQQSRGSSNQVASGTDAFVAGARNRASGPGSVGLGYSCTATGDYAQSLGNVNLSSGYSSFNAGGYGSTASGNFSITLAGAYLANRGISGSVAFGSAGADVGKRQSEMHSLSIETANATPTKLVSEPGTVAATNQIVLGANSSMAIRGVISAIQSSGGDAKGWTFEAIIKRPSNAASTVLVASSVTAIGGDTGAAAWTFALSADTTLGALAITVTGEAAKTIEWQATAIAAFAQV